MTSSGKVVWTVGVAALALLSGCKVNGGGQFPSAYAPGQKVTVALNANVAPESVKGQGEFQDKSAGVSAHLDFSTADLSTLDPFLLLNFYQLSADVSAYYGYPFGDFTTSGIFVGTYRAQGKPAGSGGFLAFAADGGRVGPGVGDFVVVQFIGGPYDGYVNGGPVVNGNFKVTGINP